MATSQLIWPLTLGMAVGGAIKLGILAEGPVQLRRHGDAVKPMDFAVDNDGAAVDHPE